MAGIFERLAYQGAEKFLPKGGLSSKLLKFTSAGRDLLGGNLNSAANKIMDNVFGRSSKFGGGGGDNIILAGVSWSKLIEMYEEAQGVQRERTNLWHVGVEPIGKIGAPRINLLATEASYNGVQLGYDPVKIGSGFTMTPTGAEAVELRLTCYDVDGEIKGWFDQLKATATHADGTFGLPSEYANTITITHGVVEEGRGYAVGWDLVPVSCEVSLARSTDEFTALNLTFTQFESFGAL